MLALKLRSSVILSVDLEVTPKMSENVIQIHPKVVLGCLANPPICETLRQNLPPPSTDFTLTSVLQAAVLVKNIINTYTENFPAGTSTGDEFFVVGALVLEKELKIYKISKEKGHSWMHGIEEVVENVAIGGICGPWVLKPFMEQCPFNPDMTEDEGILYAFEAVRYSAIRPLGTTGEIQAVSINFEHNFKFVKWRQNNPMHYMDKYHIVAFHHDCNLSM